MSSGLNRQWVGHRWLRWIILACWLLGQTEAIPDSLRAYSRVVYKKPEMLVAQLFTVEEFVSQTEGKALLKVKDNRATSPKFKSYYYLDDKTKKQNEDVSSLIEYDPEENNCKSLNADQWPLQGVMSIFERIQGNGSVQAGKGRASDGPALSPSALLRLLLRSSSKLKHSAYGESHFETILSLPEQRSLRIILSLPTGSYDRSRKALKESNTNTMADFDLHKLYSLKVSFVIMDNIDHRANYYPETLLKDLTDLESLHISFMAIQERSVSKHQGLSAFDADEENPFTLPSGAGCGSRGKLFYLNARQFSGLFVGENANAQQFAAYDGRSNHLRIDRLGRSKVIYNFAGQKGAIYVADHQSVGKKDDLISVPKDRCSSVLFQGRDEELGFHETRSMADVIGFDFANGLNYLGSKSLEDGVHCLVFERELGSPSKIPLLAKLNLRVQPQTGDRLFLTFYFVDEFRESKLNADQKQERSADRDSSLLDSVWLKRIELQAKKSFSQYNSVISRLTFSQSAWSLDVWAEYENDRQSRNLHPVRTFDTIECRPAASDLNQAFKLELIIEQIISPKVQLEQLKKANFSQQQRYGFFDQPENLEEAIMTFLTTVTRIPRSHINQLELMLPEHRLATTSLNKPESYRIIVEAKIVSPLDFQFQKHLLGWVKSYTEIALALKGDLVLLQPEESTNNRYECMLSIATSIKRDIKGTMMLFCPHVGCGYIKDLGTFEFIKAKSEGKTGSPMVANGTDTQIPTVSNYYELCEIHSLKKILLPVDTSQKIDPESVKSQLINAQFSSKTMLSRDLLDTGTDDDFVGKVVKVSTVKDGHHPSHSLGELLRTGLCYTGAPPVSSADSKSPTEFKSVQLTLDQHQSSAIYCHKACLLYPYCRTYSYHKAKRICTLTSLPKSEVLAYSLRHPAGVTNDPSCHLYGLNALQLYASLQMSLITSLAGLHSTHQYFFTSADREVCASLCHDNELNVGDRRTSCQGFKYFSLNFMCAIEDKQSHLYKKLLESKRTLSTEDTYEDQSKYYKSFLTSQSEWDEINQCQFYERDYSQYYEHRARTKFHVAQEVANQAASPDDASDGQIPKLSELKTLYDIDLHSCLRECSIIERNCLMVDHCFHPINSTPTRYCTMYEISNSSAELVLSQLLPLQASDKTESKRRFKNNPSCNNYHLTEDYLMLKTKISQVTPVIDSRLGDIGGQDANKSDSYLEGMKSFIGGQLLRGDKTREGKEFGFWSATLMLLIGSLSGSLVAFFLVEQPRIRPTIEVISNNGSSSSSASCSSNISGFKTTQSPTGDKQRVQSGLEYNEMFELYEN